jgi:hypothetical protein
MLQNQQNNIYTQTTLQLQKKRFENEINNLQMGY